MELLTSINEMSAGEGLPIVLLSALQAFGALALIVAVLVIMERVFKKKHPEWDNKNGEATDDEKASESEENKE